MRAFGLPKLLRAIAEGADAKANRHDFLLNFAANEIERLWKIEDALNERLDKEAHNHQFIDRRQKQEPL